MNADWTSQINTGSVLAARFPFMQHTALLMLGVCIIFGAIGVNLLNFRYRKKK